MFIQRMVYFDLNTSQDNQSPEFDCQGNFFPNHRPVTEQLLLPFAKQ